MSAFRVSTTHVALIAAAAQDVGMLCQWTSHLMAREMARENDASICARYRNEKHVPVDPLGLWRARVDRALHVVRRMSIVWQVKLLDCYEYQSCEHAGWRTCDVREWVHAFRDYLHEQSNKTPDELRDSIAWQTAPWCVSSFGDPCLSHAADMS